MDTTEFAVSAIFGARTVVAVVDTVADRVTFLKHEDPSIVLNTPLVFTDYIRTLLVCGGVHPEDAALFDVLTNLQELREYCHAQKSGILFSCRALREDKYRWVQFLLNVPEDYSEEKPEVLLCQRYLSAREADEHDASNTVSSSIRKVVKYDFTEDRLQLLKSPQGEAAWTSRYRSEPSDCARWQEEAFVHPEDVAAFRQGTERETIISWFLAGNSEKNVFYRRKMGGLYRWVKLIIMPSTEWTPEHPVFLFYIVDVHRTMATFSTNQNRNTRGNAQIRSVELETYYDNILNALSFFTQQYKDFYIVDLVRDQYIKYKVDRELMSGKMPLVGKYSDMAAQYMTEALLPDEQEKMLGFASLDELRMLLEDKMSFTYAFSTPDGKRYRTICTRIESENGVPTKVIFRTVPEEGKNWLKVKTFGSFELMNSAGKPVVLHSKKSRELLAYLIDKNGFPVAITDIVQDVLEKEPDDTNAVKYVSTLYHRAARDLEAAGYPDIIIKEWNALRIDTEKLDCDYYHLMQGDISYWSEYHNEYMKEYSWAEETNGEILRSGGI